MTRVDRSRRLPRHVATSGDAHANIVATRFTRNRAEAWKRAHPPSRLFTAEAVNALLGASGDRMHPPSPK